MRPEEINGMLSDRVLEVCQMLLPQGKENGCNYECGSINGESGQSLKIALSGSHLGGFKDFADEDCGDLIELWRLSKSQTFSETMTDIKSYLNIEDNYTASVQKLTKSNRKPKTIKSLPAYDAIDTNPKWCGFLEKRKIITHIAKDYKIGVWNDKLFFPHYFEGNAIMYHTRDYRKDESGKYIMKDGRPVKDFQTNKNPQYCLWGWNGIKESDRYVVITEGRIDALSYIQQGIPALSVPCGGGKGAKQSWIDYDYHHLIDHFDKIYISMDKDSMGVEAVKEITKRLGDHLCWFIELPEGMKDANEAHIAGIDLNGLISIAKQNTPEGLHKGGEFHDDMLEYFFPEEHNEPGIYLPWEKSAGYKARLGEVTLIAGENGSGKTQVVGQIMLAGMMQDEIFGIASMEMSPKMLLGRLTRQATTNYTPSRPYIQQVSEYLNDWLWLYKKKGVVKRDKILKAFLYLNKRYGVRFFVIDSLAKCGIGEDDYNGQKNFIDELEAFADDNQVHIFLVHHIRKSSQQAIDTAPKKSDVKGTGGIVDMVDNLILTWRNRPKEDLLSQEFYEIEDEKKRKERDKKIKEMRMRADMKLIVAKQRNGDWEGTINLWFNKNCYQYIESENQNPYRYVEFKKENYA